MAGTPAALVADHATNAASRIRIDILGAVRAWSDAGELPLGPPQQRSVLLLLAIAGGQPVPLWTIAEALWGNRPPPSAVNVVQTYVKRLRRVLEPYRLPRSPGHTLRRVDSGYALDAGADAVDLWRFRRLVHQAREERRAGRADRVVALLTVALELWRGPPGAALPALAEHHSVRAAAEEHATAVGSLAEAAVMAGTVEALPVIAHAAVGRPFDELLHAHLIRLYLQAGRRHDAVRTYRSCYRRLQDELGLDPGPQLTDAYQEVLASLPAPPGASRPYRR